jgi:hypothetical protein
MIGRVTSRIAATAAAIGDSPCSSRRSTFSTTTMASSTTSSDRQHHAKHAHRVIVTTAAVTANHAWMVWDTLFGVNAAQLAKPQMADGYTISYDGRLRPFDARGISADHDH